MLDLKIIILLKGTTLLKLNVIQNLQPQKCSDRDKRLSDTKILNLIFRLSNNLYAGHQNS